MTHTLNFFLYVKLSCFLFCLCAFPRLSLGSFSEENTLPPDSYIIIDSLQITGNNITKAHIIKRELLFAEKDTLLLSEYADIISQTTNNLNNTSLFNFVFIDTNDVPIYKTLSIHVIERWYLWPTPYLNMAERNFSTWWQTKDLHKIDYGFTLVKDNFRGRREDLGFSFRRGFEENYSLSYNIPYINRKQTLGMGFSFGLARNKQQAAYIENNKLVYLKVEDFYLRENLSTSLSFNYRRRIHQRHSLWLTYNNQTFADTLLMQNDFFAKNSMNTNRYFSIRYLFRDDKRDSRAYPLQGHYFSFDVNKHGLGLLENEAVDILYVRATYRKFLQLSERFYFAFSHRGKLSNYSKQPFYLKRGLGYGNDYVRGYDYYVVDGISYWLSKNNIKYELLPPQIKDIRFIKNKRFGMIHYALYLNLFFDSGYAHDYHRTHQASNDLSNTFLYSYGAGVDFVTYYDKVLRIEYAVNRMLEKGFFVNFVAPI